MENVSAEGDEEGRRMEDELTGVHGPYVLPSLSCRRSAMLAGSTRNAGEGKKESPPPPFFLFNIAMQLSGRQLRHSIAS